jgi:hypothetical protein
MLEIVQRLFNTIVRPCLIAELTAMQLPWRIQYLCHAKFRSAKAPNRRTNFAGSPLQLDYGSEGQYQLRERGVRAQSVDRYPQDE